jgi:hypothetical protein
MSSSFLFLLYRLHLKTIAEKQKKYNLYRLGNLIQPVPPSIFQPVPLIKYLIKMVPLLSQGDTFTLEKGDTLNSKWQTVQH